MEWRQLIQTSFSGLGLASTAPPQGRGTAGSRVPGVFHVSDFRAQGDGKTLDTKAIQAAIDACNRGGGGNDVHVDLIERLEVRKMIEPDAATLAAGRASPEELRDIKDHLLKLAENVNNVAVREQQDFLFHDAIIRAAGNRILRAMADTLAPMLFKSRRIAGPSHHDMNRIVRQHTAIHEAIRLGNASLAEEARRQRLLGVGIDLISEHKP